MSSAIGKRPVRFLLAGAWNTLFGFAAFTFLELSLGDVLGYLAVLAFAQILAVIQAHAVQRTVVWRSQQPYFAELSRFSLVYVAVYAANAVLLALAVEVAHAPVLPAQYLIGGLLVLATYFVQRDWTFGPR
jgi:putative flippase GtrA